MIFFARGFAVDPGDGEDVSYKINHSVLRANLRATTARMADGTRGILFRALRVRCCAVDTLAACSWYVLFGVTTLCSLPYCLHFAYLVCRIFWLGKSCCTTTATAARASSASFRGWYHRNCAWLVLALLRARFAVTGVVLFLLPQYICVLGNVCQIGTAHTRGEHAHILAHNTTDMVHAAAFETACAKPHKIHPTCRDICQQLNKTRAKACGGVGRVQTTGSAYAGCTNEHNPAKLAIFAC